MWLDACFKTVSEEYLENLKQEEKENSGLYPDHSDDGITSLKLPNDMIIYQAPPDLGDEFEIPPADSGEKKFLDSTLIKSDSSFTSLDSTITNTDTLAAKDSVKIVWR
jgi:hypothetical protein